MPNGLLALILQHRNEFIEMRQLISSLIYILISVTTFATTLFSHKSNDFKYLLMDTNNQSSLTMGIDDNCLNIYNPSSSLSILTENANIPHNYTYTVKLSTPNNRPGKRNEITKDDGTRVRTNKILWGVSVDIQPNGDMITVECESDNSNINDEISNNRNAKINIVKHSSTGLQVLASKTIDKGFNLYNKNNILSVTVNDNNMAVSIGRKELKQILSINIDRPDEPYRTGIIAGPGTRLAIERTMLNFDRDSRMIINTKWTQKSLDEYFSKNSSPIEGYWQYLDRDIEDKWMKLGGQYIIAIVANEHNGYDIIYLDGAQTNKTHWQPFMLKGNLSKTMFNGVFKAQWIDATFNALNQDVQAVIENGVILSIKFPIFKSQLRFSKVIK